MTFEPLLIVGYIYSLLKALLGGYTDVKDVGGCVCPVKQSRFEGGLCTGVI